MLTSLTVDAPALVDQLLEQAVLAGASDIHVEPTAEACEVRLRVDGLLQVAQRHDAATGRSLVTRLMVMAHLLTYRLDIPQEGRLTALVPAAGKPLDLRLAVMPTTHGLRAAVRLPADLLGPGNLDSLGLPPGILAGLKRFAAADTGMLILTGPAGSGKTTTIYALLEHIRVASPGLSIITLEDPVERNLPGITQIQVTPFGELTYERSLRSILRQDPQVLMLGEIRDAATASLAIQAALSGHRLICTLHAASPAGGIARLLEMGIEPYQITSALFAIVSQRLLRRSAICRTGFQPVLDRLEACPTDYRGRIPVAEMMLLDPPVRQAILRRADADEVDRLARAQVGYVTLRQAAGDLAARGLTDSAEIARVLGPAEEF